MGPSIPLSEREFIAKIGYFKETIFFFFEKDGNFYLQQHPEWKDSLVKKHSRLPNDGFMMSIIITNWGFYCCIQTCIWRYSLIRNYKLKRTMKMKNQCSPCLKQKTYLSENGFMPQLLKILQDIVPLIIMI